MSNPQKRKYRRIDKTGRSKGEPLFVMHSHYLLDSEAYLALSAVGKATYTLLRRRFNGSNNGRIICSIRDVANFCRCSKDSATAALKDLQDKGFIKCTQRGSFNWKKPHASEWILTEEPLGDALATKEFMRWHAPKENYGPEKRTAGPAIRTDVLEEGPTDTEHCPGIRTEAPE